jgi:putative restriction endonuclease
MSRRPWSRAELMLAMNLYCQLPFGRMHRGTPEIITLAAAMGRTPSSVAMKLSNLASLDPAHQERGVKGLTSTSVADREIWDEFHQDWGRLAAESEQLRAAARLSLDAVPDNDAADVSATTETSAMPLPAAVVVPEFAGATEAQRSVKVRLAQRFFRRTVLASFDGRCCISQIAMPELLIASHIVPWQSAQEHRADPRNGLCLSRLHDGAFDQGLITLDEDFRLVLSRELRDHLSNEVLRGSFEPFAGRPIRLPGRFRPRLEFLAHHSEHIFRG